MRALNGRSASDQSKQASVYNIDKVTQRRSIEFHMSDSHLDTRKTEHLCCRFRFFLCVFFYISVCRFSSIVRHCGGYGLITFELHSIIQSR